MPRILPADNVLLKRRYPSQYESLRALVARRNTQESEGKNTETPKPPASPTPKAPHKESPDSTGAKLLSIFHLKPDHLDYKTMKAQLAFRQPEALQRASTRQFAGLGAALGAAYGLYEGAQAPTTYILNEGDTQHELRFWGLWPKDKPAPSGAYEYRRLKHGGLEESIHFNTLARGLFGWWPWGERTKTLRWRSYGAAREEHKKAGDQSRGRFNDLTLRWPTDAAAYHLRAEQTTRHGQTPLYEARLNENFEVTALRPFAKKAETGNWHDNEALQSLLRDTPDTPQPTEAELARAKRGHEALPELFRHFGRYRLAFGNAMPEGLSRQRPWKAWLLKPLGFAALGGVSFWALYKFLFSPISPFVRWINSHLEYRQHTRQEGFLQKRSRLETNAVLSGTSNAEADQKIGQAIDILDTIGVVSSQQAQTGGAKP